MKMKHVLKMIAPIIVSIIVFFVLFLYTYFLMFEYIPIVFRIITIVVFIFLEGVSIYVLVERIIEIRSGDEDDLSKY